MIKVPGSYGGVCFGDMEEYALHTSMIHHTTPHAYTQYTQAVGQTIILSYRSLLLYCVYSTQSTEAVPYTAAVTKKLLYCKS